MYCSSKRSLFLYCHSHSHHHPALKISSRVPSLYRKSQDEDTMKEKIKWKTYSQISLWSWSLSLLSSSFTIGGGGGASGGGDWLRHSEAIRYIYLKEEKKLFENRNLGNGYKKREQIKNKKN